MWKTVVLVFIVLTTAIGGMLFWQWKAYSKQNSSTSNNPDKILQEITVTSNPDHLFINQKIKGLTAGKEYKLNKPENLDRLVCINRTGMPCKIHNGKKSMVVPEQDELTFEFIIPISIQEKAFLLRNWTISLKEVEIFNSSIHIIDSFDRGGTWVVGSRMNGYKKMDLIDFYSFEGRGNTPGLYWQAKPLQELDSGNDIIRYSSSHNLHNTYKFKEIQSIHDFPFVTVIFTDQLNEQISSGLLITRPNINETDLKRKIIHYYYTQKFNELAKKHDWIIDLFSSYTANVPALTTKGKEVLDEIRLKMSERELMEFFDEVNHSSSSLTLENLDGFIRQIKGMNTRFFQSNREETDIFVPLFFYDARNVLVNGTMMKDFEVIFEEGKILFPFIKTMRALNFEAEILTDKETIVLTKGKNTYRFFLNRNIFIYNDEDYGLLERPLAKINGKIYIEKQWIEVLFKAKIKDGKEEIIISYDG